MYGGQLCCQARSWYFPQTMVPHGMLATAQQGPADEEICRPEGLNDFPVVTQLVSNRVLSSRSRFPLPHRQKGELHRPEGHRAARPPCPGASPWEVPGAGVSSAGPRRTRGSGLTVLLAKGPFLLGFRPTSSCGPFLPLQIVAAWEREAGPGTSGAVPGQARRSVPSLRYGGLV